MMARITMNNHEHHHLIESYHLIDDCRFSHAFPAVMVCWVCHTFDHNCPPPFLECAGLINTQQPTIASTPMATSLTITPNNNNTTINMMMPKTHNVDETAIQWMKSQSCG